MFYKCLRCGKSKEIRKGSKTGSNATPYNALEKAMKESRIVHLESPRPEKTLPRLPF
jgi:hypothetical protein